MRLHKFEGFASQTFPSRSFRELMLGLRPSNQLKRALQAIRMAEATRERYATYGFGKWIHHPAQVQTLLQGQIYEVSPITAEFVPTLECNYACPKCTYTNWKNRTAEEKGLRFMDVTLMRYLLDRLKSAGIKAVIWTGGGEPTLHPNLLKGMRYAKSLGLRNGLFTNGSLLTTDMIEELLYNIAPNFIRISLNAPSAETHRRVHCYRDSGNLFSRILETLEYIARNKMARETATAIGIGVLVRPGNIETLQEFGPLIQQLLSPNGRQSGILDHIVFRPEVNYGGREKHQLDPQSSDRARTIFRGSIRPALAGIHGFSPYFIDERFDDLLVPQQAQAPFCLAHPWRVSVAYDGKLYLCAEQNGNPDFCIGDLNTQDFRDIWYGKRRKAVIANLNNGMYHNACPPICVLTYMNKVLNRIPFPLSAVEAAEINNAINALRGRPHPDVDFL